MSPQMKWTQEMLERLMHEIYMKKMHTMVHKAGVSKAWDAFVVHLFDQDEFSFAKTDHPDQMNQRNVRNKYLATMKAVQDRMEKGNLSGEEGELDILHKTVQNIQNDLDDLDEIKQREADNKRRLAENEEGILSPDRPKKNLSRDGVAGIVWMVR